jgi:hypothetical protein
MGCLVIFQITLGKWVPLFLDIERVCMFCLTLLRFLQMEEMVKI